MEPINSAPTAGGGLFAKARGFFALIGVISTLFVLSAATGSYQPAYTWLSSAEYSSKCDYIVLLPAGPVPNMATLGRAYKTAEEYAKNPSAKVIITHKMEEKYIGSTLWTIKKELLLRGVPEEAIILEPKARSTNEHARYIREQKLGDYRKNSYLLVSSPMHIKRAVMTFKAAGFVNVYAIPAAMGETSEDLGRGRFFRYGFWGAMMSQIGVLRELSAIIFYKINGWA